MNTEKIEFQQRLSEKVNLPFDRKDAYQPQNGDIICSMDIQYENNIGYVAVDILEYPNTLIGIYTHKVAVLADYEPSFFSFREGPLLLSALKEVTAKQGIQPDLLIIDGHGIAHPRKFGVASYLGVCANLPSIGVAKRTLLKYDGELGEKRGSTLPILLNEEIVGKVLRTQDLTNPIFVSSGHLIHLDTACDLVLALAPNYKNIEPIRRADKYARLFAKGEVEAGFVKY
jgi:deoxyribonuclease V